MSIQRQNTYILRCALIFNFGETFSFSLDTKDEISAHIPVHKARKVSPSTMKRNALRRQKLLASKNKASSEKVTMENPAENSVIQKSSVSCEECSHTTQTVGGMKLDGVAPLITDPPPTSFQNLSKKKQKK